MFFAYNGDIADDTMKPMSIDENTVKLLALIANFDAYYGVRKNMIVAKAKF